MTTRADIRNEVESRLGDTANVVWTEALLNGIIDFAIQGLYPTFFQREVAETTAGAGPIQTMPADARNLYMLGHKRLTSTRVRALRKWEEGDGEAYIPRTGIAGDTLVWAWTQGWSAPSSDTQALSFPSEAAEVVVLRTMVAALEYLLTDRVSQQKFHAIQVREGNSESDIDLLISNLRDSLTERLARALPLPEVQK